MFFSTAMQINQPIRKTSVEVTDKYITVPKEIISETKWHAYFIP
jgi:hypothetical protein